MRLPEFFQKHINMTRIFLRPVLSSKNLTEKAALKVSINNSNFLLPAGGGRGT